MQNLTWNDTIIDLLYLLEYARHFLVHIVNQHNSVMMASQMFSLQLIFDIVPYLGTTLVVIFVTC